MSEEVGAGGRFDIFLDSEMHQGASKDPKRKNTAIIPSSNLKCNLACKKRFPSSTLAIEN